MNRNTREATQLRQWLLDNQPLLVAIGSIGSLGCALATLVAVIVAGYSLAQTNKQLEATTVYNIQKDGRELLQSIQSDAQLSDYLFRYDATQSYCVELKARADRELAIIMQFYTSVSNQRRNGIISEGFWTDFEREFCNFLQGPIVTRFWDQKVLPGAYDDYFKEVGQRCLGRQFIRKSTQKRYFSPTEK